MGSAKENKQQVDRLMPILEINRVSDFYRVCPACEREFVAHHRSMKFCNNHCHDEYNNRIKREKKFTATTETSETSQVQALRSNLEENIKLLSTLTVQQGGTEYYLIDLHRMGITFEAYEARFPLDAAGKFHYLKYGPFNMYWTTTEKVLLTIQNTEV
jgi:hypothetical protein